MIHRDLKPANIKVKDDGTVKVLDFGLAKALDTIPQGDPSLSPTLTAAATQMGVILGTAAYMSPEQAAGQASDKRSDLWSFGVVLFEMLTGQQLFTGETVSHVLAKVLDRELDFSALPTSTPAPISRLLLRCLERRPKKRLSDVSEALFHLKEAAATPTHDPSAATGGAPVTESAWWRQVPSLAGALIVGSFITGLAVWTLKPPPPQPVTRFSISVPPSVPVRLSPQSSDVAISPDGGRIVYQAADLQLYVRPIDQIESAPLRGALPAVSLFLSSDDAWVGFMAGPGGLLQKVSVFGGPPITICELPANLRGASWGEDDVIIFGTASSDGLMRVSGAGGAPEAITTPEQSRHKWPDILPGGAGVLFTVDRAPGTGSEDIALLNMETREHHVIIPGGTHPRYSPTGHIVYGVEGTLRAVAFDLDTLEVTSDPVPVVEGVLMKGEGAASFDLSDSGALVYISGAAGTEGGTRAFVWVDRDGREEPLPLPPDSYDFPLLSPDESALAVSVRNSAEEDIRVLDLARGSTSRITFGGVNRFPIWSPDGAQLVFAEGGRGSDTSRVQLASSAGGGAIDTLLDRGESQYPTSWASNGQAVAFYITSPDTGRDLWVLPMDGDQTPVPFLVTPFNERAGRFSPDGRWLAYVSDESGRDEVYVRPYPPGPSQEETISTNGGRGPVWSRDGRELYYQNGEQVMVVAVDAGGSFRASPPKLLFMGDYAQPNRNGAIPTYDVSQDGRFLMMKNAATDEGQASAQVVLVQNFAEELARLFPDQ